MLRTWQERKKFGIEIEFMKAYQFDPTPVYNAQIDNLFSNLTLEEKMAVTCYFCMYPFDNYNPSSMTYRKAAKILKWPTVRVHRTVKLALKKMRKH